MRYITDEDEIRETERWIREAEIEARKSTCKKSQRGVVIVNGGEIIGRGRNDSTIPRLCDPCIRERINNNSRVELCPGKHAELEAMINATKPLDRAWLYHIAIKDGEVVPSDDISCTICSRHILETGIKHFVIKHTKGYAIYDVEEFNNLSFRYFGFGV